MRVYDESVAPSGKKRVLFACGIEDIQIMAGLVAKAKMYTPRIDADGNNVEMHHRLNSMSKEFGKYLNQSEKKPKYHKTTPCPYCERVLRGDKALVMHLAKVHTEKNEEAA
jgi:hypothetical protein